MSEAKRMEDAEWTEVRAGVEGRPGSRTERMKAEAERARASEAALEARLAAGVEAAKLALVALEHETICSTCAQGACSDCYCCERDRTEAALRSFVGDREAQ